MPTVEVGELSANTSQLVRHVHTTGEAVEITHRGEAVARLVPIERIETEGDIETRLANRRRLIEEIGKHLVPGTSAVDSVREMRREL